MGVTEQCWDAIKRTFPDAIYLPYNGIFEKNIDRNIDRNIDNDNENDVEKSGDKNVGRNNGRNFFRKSIDRNIAKNDNENNNEETAGDLNDVWLCLDCLNERQEGTDECNNQKASRTIELSDINLLNLYNTKRNRNDNKTRHVIKAQKKTVEERNEEMITEMDTNRMLTADDKRYAD